MVGPGGTVCQSFSLSEKSDGEMTPVWLIAVFFIINGGTVFLGVFLVLLFGLESLRLEELIMM